MGQFIDDPSRPLACAFNFPAVALTLGAARWEELRGLYLTLAEDRSSKVRRSLAASIGEVARIIGPQNAAKDLVQVWWDVMRIGEDGDVRLKAIEALPLFVESLGEGEARDQIFSGLVRIWEGRWLSRSWRARECLIRVLFDLVGSPGHPECVQRLLLNGLEDDFGTVRDAAIHVVSPFLLFFLRLPCSALVSHQITRIWADSVTWATIVVGLCQDILALANAPSHRKRMT